MPSRAHVVPRLQLPSRDQASPLSSPQPLWGESDRAPWLMVSCLSTYSPQISVKLKPRSLYVTFVGWYYCLMVVGNDTKTWR